MIDFTEFYMQWDFNMVLLSAGYLSFRTGERNLCESFTGVSQWNGSAEDI